MTFPNTPLDTVVELFIDGAWTDVTSDVYLRDPITITRGRSAQGDDIDPTRCAVTFNNRSGKYSPRNPTGTYYGKIGRNTPLRVSVRAGTVALDLPHSGSDYATTPDTAALDVTGDIDVRFDGTLSNWLSPYSGDAFHHVCLVDKTGAVGQKSWLFAVRNYGLYFEWSADGTNILNAASTVPLSAGPDTRMAVRATLDVNNGASGNTVTFYTADTMSGTWVQLGDPVTASGTTSIFNSTTQVSVGMTPSYPFTGAVGKVHKVQVLNGIGGTAVANPDFTAQTAGATSFTDAAGRTWSVSHGGASLTNRQVRFVGEVSEWPVEWDLSGADVYTTVSAAGILRRLNQGATPIKSTMTRTIPAASGILAYWPMEEGTDSTVAYSPLDDVEDMTTSGLTFAAVDTLPGSSALPTLGTASAIEGVSPAPSTTQTTWQVEFVYSFTGTTTTYRTLMTINCLAGTIRTWKLQVSGNTLARVIGYDEDGAVVLTDARVVGSDLTDGRWNRWQHSVSVSGGTVSYQTVWINVGGSGGSASGTYAGSIGRVKSVGAPDGGYSAELSGMAIGHVGVFSPRNTTAYNNVDIGMRGETAGTRLTRLATEEGITLGLFGDSSIQAAVGAQKPAAILDILKDCADADGGILYEQRTAAGLVYRDVSSLFNQRVRLALNYSTAGHIAPPFKPSDDDQYVRNDITVTRTNGTSAMSELTTGALSTQSPPAGVGRYQDSTEINFYTDAQPAQMAEWLLHLGTWDEARYPSVHVDLSAAPSLIDDVTAVDIGDRITISNPPAWIPPDTIDLMVQGYSEVIGVYDWDVTFNCTPGGPWSSVALVGTARADTAGSSLGAAATSSATSLYVVTSSGPEWVDSIASASDFPFDVRVAGERVTVTACTGNAVDAFGRTSASSWGTADVGGAWTASGGTSADFAVGSGIGTVTLATANASRRTVLSTSFNDFDYYVSIATSALATGGFLSGALTARYTDSDNLYTARAAFNSDASITLSIRKRVATVETELVNSTIPALTHVAGTFYRMRFYGSGTTFKAKLWLSTDSESADWDCTTTDSSIATGAFMGTRSISATGNTNVNPVIRYDDYKSNSPQLMTVTRAVNGVSKAQASGAAVSLWAPYYVPLDS